MNGTTRTSGSLRNNRQLDLFYNTTNMSEAELKIRKQNTASQNGRIMKFFRDNPEGYFTPFEVQIYADLGRTPITSIRRSINTLTRAGLLIKTSNMRTGEYGVKNHTWKWKTS